MSFSLTIVSMRIVEHIDIKSKVQLASNIVQNDFLCLPIKASEATILFPQCDKQEH